tara:strand:- start:754 stop:1035 length:282 start_codon:yes stop_codon:yes gene_type:complete
MRISESQLRRVIRSVIQEEYHGPQSGAPYQVSGGDGDPLQNFQGAEPGKQSHIDPMLQQKIEMAAKKDPSFLDELKLFIDDLMEIGSGYDVRD